MTATFTTTPLTSARVVTIAPAAWRGAILAIIAAALIAGLMATGTQAASLAAVHDGAALVRLLRFMAVIKGAMVIAASAAVLWRLGAPISLPWFAAYAVSCASMAAGQGLIWGLAHVGIGALLLHGGLLTAIMLVWFDPAVGIKLANIVAARRQRMAVIG